MRLITEGTAVFNMLKSGRRAGPSCLDSGEGLVGADSARAIAPDMLHRVGRSRTAPDVLHRVERLRTAADVLHRVANVVLFSREGRLMRS